MNIMVRPRQGGKTRTLMEWVLHDPENRAVLFADERQRDGFIKLIYNAWMSSMSPSVRNDPRYDIKWWSRCAYMPMNIARNLSARDHRLQVSIDNLEEVLFTMLGRPVDIATTSDSVLEYYEAGMH